MKKETSAARESCEGCRFWRPDPGDRTRGDCRRYPPILDPFASTMEQDDDLAARYTFPITPGYEWCGEFKWVGLPGLTVERSEAAEPEVTLATPVEKLGFSTRTSNALEFAGLGTVARLTAATADDLLGIRHFGEKSLAEVRVKLHCLGFGLAGEKVSLTND